MGDFRMTVQIEVDYLDKHYQFGVDGGASINWCPEDGESIDPRVKEFFDAMWDDARSRYNDLVWESRREEESKATEKRDRAEYERLKAKYDHPPTEEK
jgi:hypothetical protein